MCGRDIIGERLVGIAFAFDDGFFIELTAGIPAQQLCGFAFIFKQHNRIVIHRVGWVQTKCAFGGQPSLIHNAFEHVFGITEDAARFNTDDLIVQNGRERTSQVPYLEERPPVDVMR